MRRHEREKRSVRARSAEFRGLETLESRLLMDATVDAGDTLDTAQNLGTLVTSAQVIDTVGGADAGDVFRFTLAETQSLRVTLNGLTRNADVQLIRDLNTDGVIDDGEIFAASTNKGTRAELIRTKLDAGDYFVRVLPASGEGRYRLTLIATAGAFKDVAGDVYEPDDTPETASELLVNGASPTHSLHASFDVDWSVFELNRTSDVTIATNGRSGDTQLRLYSGDNVVIPIAFDEDAGAGRFAKIKVRLEPGVYLVRVNESGMNERIGSYTVGVKAVGVKTIVDLDGVPANARALGAMLGTRTLRDTLGGPANDRADYYKFTVITPIGLRVTQAASEWPVDAAILTADGLPVLPIAVSDVFSGANAGAAVYLLDVGDYFVRASLEDPLFSSIDAGSATPNATGDLLVSSAILRGDNAAGFGGITGTPRIRPYELTLEAVLISQLVLVEL